MYATYEGPKSGNADELLVAHPDGDEVLLRKDRPELVESEDLIALIEAGIPGQNVSLSEDKPSTVDVQGFASDNAEQKAAELGVSEADLENVTPSSDRGYTVKDVEAAHAVKEAAGDEG